MIYTVGHKESYEKYFETCENPQKAIGGSVWQNWKSAWWYTRSSQSLYIREYDCYVRALVPNDFAVYGVWADWKWHTIDNGNGWNDLLIDADLVKIREEWGGTLVS